MFKVFPILIGFVLSGAVLLGPAQAQTPQGIPFGGYYRTDTRHDSRKVLVYLKAVAGGDQSEAYGLILRSGGEGKDFRVSATLYKVELWAPKMMIWVPVTQNTLHYLNTPADYKPIYVSQIQTTNGVTTLAFSSYSNYYEPCVRHLKTFTVAMDSRLQWLDLPAATNPLTPLTGDNDGDHDDKTIAVSGTSVTGKLTIANPPTGPFYLGRNPRDAAFGVLRMEKIDSTSSSGWALNREILAVVANVTDESGDKILNFINLDARYACNFTDVPFAKDGNVSTSLFQWKVGWSLFGGGSSSRTNSNGKHCEVGDDTCF